MTAAAPLGFPGSRVVAGWWRQLAPLRPQALWVGHFLLQRVEALVEVSRPLYLDPFARLVLEALTLPGGRTPRELDARLHLGPQVVLRVLRRLEAEALAQPGPGDEWAPAPRARQALGGEGGGPPALERRTFPFISAWPAPGAAGHAPHYLNLSSNAFPAVRPPDDSRFDPGLLGACVRRPAVWKQRHTFPADVQGVLIPDRGGAGQPPTPVPDWLRVILVGSEHLSAVLALVTGGGDGERLLGFGVRIEGWGLDTGQPGFALAAGWEDTFPELAVEPGLEAWRQAWHAWCQPRGLPQAEADACTLERRACRLHVAAPRRFVDRLRAARSDALKGDAWVLAGTGSVRALAQLQVAEPGEGPAGEQQGTV